MQDPSEAMQKAIHAKLVASSGLAALMGGTARVFDKVLKGAVYPYVRIGDDQAIGRSNACSDGWDFYSTVHSFSQHAQAPRIEAKQIQAEVLAALATFGDLPAPVGFKIMDCEVQTARAFLEPDGLTGHSLVTIFYRVRPTA